MVLRFVRRVSTSCVVCLVSAAIVPGPHAREIPSAAPPRTATPSRLSSDHAPARRTRSGQTSTPVAQATGAATSDATWAVLSSSGPGTKVRLVLTDGSEVVGQLVTVRADAVVLEKNRVRQGPFSPPAGSSLRDPLTFARTQVTTVEEVRGWPRWAKVLLWVGIGWAVAGVIVAGIVGNS